MAVCLLLPAVALLPHAEASDGNRVLTGTALWNVDEMEALGAKPDMGLMWVEVATKHDWSRVDRQLQRAQEEGVIPVIQWYYWGDDISPHAVKNGVYSDLHGGWKTQGDWHNMATTLAKRIRANLGDDPAIVVLETEFNKGGIQHWAPFDDHLVKQIRTFNAHAPNVKTVLGFGSWGFRYYDNFGGAIEAVDYLGFQDLVGATRDPARRINESVTHMVDAASHLHETYGKPTFLTHWGVSTYADHEDTQARLVREFFDRLDELKAAGMIGFTYRALKDEPGFSTQNYYGVAERYWGFIRSDGSWKPAMRPWLNGVEAVGAASHTPTSGTGSGSTAFVGPGGERFLLQADAASAATTGRAVRDDAASNGRAWALWKDGEIRNAFRAETGGPFELNVKARGDEARGTSPYMKVYVDDRLAGEYYVNARDAYWDYQSTVHLTPGDREVRVAFTNDLWDPATGGDRNLYVDHIALDGPASAVHDGATAPAPFDVRFEPRNGNPWWVQVSVDATDTVADVEARVDGGTWTSLREHAWGWGKSLHAPDGSVVEFRAKAADGRTATSDAYAWPSGTPASGSPRADPTAAAAPDVTFAPRNGGVSWLQTTVVADAPVDHVDARVDNGNWMRLQEYSWGWARSAHAPDGSVVTFRATTTDGHVTESEPYHWPSGTRVDGDDALRVTFNPRKGGTWWVQTDVVANRDLTTVEARADDGPWTALDEHAWGWATSMHAPKGSNVVFRATAADGDTVRSRGFTWPQ